MKGSGTAFCGICHTPDGKKERYNEYKTAWKGIIDNQTAKIMLTGSWGWFRWAGTEKTKGDIALTYKLHVGKTHLAWVYFFA